MVMLSPVELYPYSSTSEAITAIASRAEEERWRASRMRLK